MIPFDVGTTPDDRYAHFDQRDGAEVCRFDDSRAPGSAQPNLDRARAYLDALRLVELIADDENEAPLRREAAAHILTRAGAR